MDLFWFFVTFGGKNCYNEIKSESYFDSITIYYSDKYYHFTVVD